MVSPRKSRRKSECFSSTTTSTPARASRKPSIIPAGPPPAMQHLTRILFAIHAGRYVSGDDMTGPIHRLLSADHKVAGEVVFLADVLKKFLSWVPEKKEAAGPRCGVGT